MIDKVLDDLKRTHLIVNAEAGHGKSTSVKTIIKRLKEQEPKVIVKIFDVSLAWWHKAPVGHRQKITVQIMIELLKNNRVLFENVGDCIYELGELDDDLRRFFIATIINQDYTSRRAVKEKYGDDAIKHLPRVIYVFEESDLYFQSRYLNSKESSARVLSEFVKTGRNFGLRGVCIVTAATGELGTKLRRRSKHLIGKIISDSDYRVYNRMKKWKTENGRVGLGDLALRTERFNWLYYNGKVTEPFRIRDEVENVPEDLEPIQTRVTELEKMSVGLSWQSWFIIILLGVVGLLLAMR